MKHKFLIALLTVTACLALVFGAAACNNSASMEQNEELWSIERVYATAQELGFEGSLEDLIALFKGENGKDGADGVGIENIEVNDNGELIITLTNGKSINCGVVKGADGKSAYEIWLENGHEGTEEDFLEWLRGGQCDCDDDENEDDEETEPPLHTEHTYGVDNVCSVCGDVWAYTEGLELTLLKDYQGPDVYLGVMEGRFLISFESLAETYVVTGIGKASGDIVIPYGYNGKPVTMIMEDSFNRCDKLTSVVIPGSVHTVWLDAFLNCKALKSVTMLPGVTHVGDCSFYGCNALENIIIPDSVTTIEEGAFYDTAYYNNENNWEEDVLYIGNHLIEARTTLAGTYKIKDNTKVIAGSAFSGCDGLTEVIIPNSVVMVGYFAFGGCTGLTSIHIPDGVITIGCGAFNGCSSLANISIPESLTYIEEDVFNDTAFFNDDANWENDVLYLDNHLIRAKETLTGSYAIKAGTKEIVSLAFADCEKLTSIDMPESVIAIGFAIFDRCFNLTEVVIPSGVTWIGLEMFSWCHSLTSIRYNGTTAQWQNIEKGAWWDDGTGDYTVTCTDGTVSKDGTVTPLSVDLFVEEKR